MPLEEFIEEEIKDEKLTQSMFLMFQSMFLFSSVFLFIFLLFPQASTAKTVTSSKKTSSQSETLILTNVTKKTIEKDLSSILKDIKGGLTNFTDITSNSNSNSSSNLVSGEFSPFVLATLFSIFFPFPNPFSGAGAVLDGLKWAKKFYDEEKKKHDEKENRKPGFPIPILPFPPIPITGATVALVGLLLVYEIYRIKSEKHDLPTITQPLNSFFPPKKPTLLEKVTAAYAEHTILKIMGTVFLIFMPFVLPSIMKLLTDPNYRKDVNGMFFTLISSWFKALQEIINKFNDQLEKLNEARHLQDQKTIGDLSSQIKDLRTEMKGLNDEIKEATKEYYKTEKDLEMSKQSNTYLEKDLKMCYVAYNSCANQNTYFKNVILEEIEANPSSKNLLTSLVKSGNQPGPTDRVINFLTNSSYSENSENSGKENEKKKKK